MATDFDHYPPAFPAEHHASSPTANVYSQIKLPERPGLQEQSVESVGQGNVMMPLSCQAFLSLQQCADPLRYLDHTSPVANRANHGYDAFRLSLNIALTFASGPSISTHMHQYLRYTPPAPFILHKWGKGTPAQAFPGVSICQITNRHSLTKGRPTAVSCS